MLIIACSIRVFARTSCYDTLVSHFNAVQATSSDCKQAHHHKLHVLSLSQHMLFASQLFLKNEPCCQNMQFGADDPQLAEFLQLMQPRRAGTIWSNDDVTLAQATAKGATSTTSKQPPTDKVWAQPYQQPEIDSDLLLI